YATSSIQGDEQGSTFFFDGKAAKAILGEQDTGDAGLPGDINAGDDSGEFSGWQTGDGVYISQGADGVKLADGSTLSADRIYYIIRRDAPDGKAAFQLADTQDDAMRGKA